MGVASIYAESLFIRPAPGFETTTRQCLGRRIFPRLKAFTL